MKKRLDSDVAYNSLWDNVRIEDDVKHRLYEVIVTHDATCSAVIPVEATDEDDACEKACAAANEYGWLFDLNDNSVSDYYCGGGEEDATLVAEYSPISEADLGFSYDDLLATLDKVKGVVLAQLDNPIGFEQLGVLLKHYGVKRPLAEMTVTKLKQGISVGPAYVPQYDTWYLLADLRLVVCMRGTHEGPKWNISLHHVEQMVCDDHDESEE